MAKLTRRGLLGMAVALPLAAKAPWPTASPAAGPPPVRVAEDGGTDSMSMSGSPSPLPPEDGEDG